MIIYSVNNMKIYETRSDVPSFIDFTNGRAEYIIDENKKENAELVNDIKRLTPFFIIKTDDNGNIISVEDDIEARTAFNASKTDPIEKVKAAKLVEISKACNDAIIAGVDVETSQGVEHFSLEETDQINLNAALQAVAQGATHYPYHADKQLCRMFSAEEILAVVEVGTNHKVYHTTLCNHLLVWVRRAETVEEVKNITYSADNLPEDLAANMQIILNPAPVIDPIEVDVEKSEVTEELTETTASESIEE